MNLLRSGSNTISQQEKDLQEKVDLYEKLLNTIRWDIREMDGVTAPDHTNFFIHYTASDVVSEWLDRVQKKKAADLEKAKIVQIVNEELDKRKAAECRPLDDTIAASKVNSAS